MVKILAIAHNTFREAVRQKLLYGLVFFTILLIIASSFLGQLSIANAETKIVKDMGLASIFIMGAFISLSMGISLVFKEIDRKTIYTILAKPVSRFEFILGKFFGLIFTVGVEIFLMTCLVYGLLATYPESLDWNLWKAVVLIYTELCILVSITLVFSSYSSSFMTSLFCFSFLIVGHLTDDLIAIMADKERWYERRKLMTPFKEFFFDAGEKLISIFNLDYFAINSKIVHGVNIPWSYVLYCAMYGFCFILLFLFVANYIFSRKDLK
jgi:ABC-type transport system involved in multi-copper enzyme maturation permease subunit